MNGTALLRRSWLVALIIVATIGGGSALAMRAELFDAGRTLAPELYSSVFSLHAVAMTGVVVAALIALPTLILESTHVGVVLGALAFVTWAAAIAFLMRVALAVDGWTAGSLHTALVVVSVGVAFAVAQQLVALHANRAHRARAIVVIGSILALVVVGIPLVGGDFPHRIHLLIAGTLAACSVIPMALASVASTIVWLAVLPCLAAAWITSAVLEAVHVGFLPDTVAMVSPLPALGAAVLAALFVAVAQDRTLVLRRAQIAATLLAVGAVATSTGFLLLGLRGMPRRYQQYDDSFQPLQIVVGIAAAVTVLGALLALRSMRAKRS
jgi:heme/copper-type cytochrome/quinol oxidase subunit 1